MIIIIGSIILFLYLLNSLIIFYYINYIMNATIKHFNDVIHISIKYNLSGYSYFNLYNKFTYISKVFTKELNFKEFLLWKNVIKFYKNFFKLIKEYLIFKKIYKSFKCKYDVKYSRRKKIKKIKTK